MKRNVMIIMAAVLVICSALCFTACGDEYADSEFVGKWECTTGEANGIKIDAGQLMGGFELELKADSIAEATLAGEKSSGEWEPSDNGFKLKQEEKELEFVKKGEDVVIDYENVRLTFEKKADD